MNLSLHHLLMANHMLLQKQLFAHLKDTELTLGQPKVLDYLRTHDGAVQKDIASACHIDPASLTSVLNGMEKKHLIVRKPCHTNRRFLHVCLTEKGQELAARIDREFSKLEQIGLDGFTQEEQDLFHHYLLRLYENMNVNQ